jgi:hypothetical protein
MKLKRSHSQALDHIFLISLELHQNQNLHKDIQLIQLLDLYSCKIPFKSGMNYFD